jgi:5'-methylthioadenosine phosphorylase
VQVCSAGTSPASVHPRALDTITSLGLDIEGLHSKGLANLPDELELVITLCDDARDHCPTIAGARHVHWPIADPSACEGDPKTVESAFVTARDALIEHITSLAQSLRQPETVGIIGGSGFYDLPGIERVETIDVSTPFGKPSAPITLGHLGNKRVAFVARHGHGHHLLPGEINVRANLYALRRLGVRHVIGISAVGSLRDTMPPGDVVLPRQFIDRTQHRPATFFGDGAVAHVSLADPVCPVLCRAVLDAASDVLEPSRVHDDATYVCIEGPQFSTRAESHLMRTWGADVVGMTCMPEARLAREAQMSYVALTLPTDYDCWRDRHEEVQVDELLATLRANVETARRIVAQAVAALDVAADNPLHRTLETALLTPRTALPARFRTTRHAILNAPTTFSEPA